MQKNFSQQSGQNLQFQCQNCHSPVLFSVLERPPSLLICSHCDKKYAFEDKVFLRQLQKFEALCKQIYASEEILGSTAIAIDVGTHHVKVPFNILLTRLSSVIELRIDGQKFVIYYRVEPLKDVMASPIPPTTGPSSS